MKQIASILFLLVVLNACKQEQDFKAVRNEVIAIHDEVMAKHDKIIHGQMKLDSMLKNMDKLKKDQPQLDTAAERRDITNLLSNLNKAEDAMNGWMRKFEPDVTGKPNAEAVTYFEAEKAKITSLAKLYDQEIKNTDTYLLKFSKH